ncbi:hypothetical protein R3P38DRAFT_3243245 [Favolaschia claudopus]|uniref:Uncharacterized protein n=1 Tax=Favolaschia claudopus TaxID=2862362 RepID=A0AAV9Z316_9AGAR
MPRAEPSTPTRRRAARPSHSARPPPKLARTAASVAAAAAASASSPPLASTSASAPPPSTKPTKPTTKTKSPKKTKDPAPWRHPAELPYIRSPSTKRDDGGGGKWDDMAIVRFLVTKAGFSIPPRSTSSPPSDELFQVHFPLSLDPNQDLDTKAGEVVSLPLPYRLPLLWTAKCLWTSLHLVLTADPAIREREWRETRFEILHLARLIEALVTGANRGSDEGEAASSQADSGETKNTIAATWRCPPFDRALRRFWHHWLISRDEFVRDFWTEFGEEEFEGGEGVADVLQLAWPRWVLKGHKGFLLTKAEVANGIPVVGFLRGFWVDEERGEFGYPEADNLKKDDEDEPSGNEVVNVEGGGGGEEGAPKIKSKKKIVKKPKPTPPTQSQDDSVQPNNATTPRKSSLEGSGSSSKEKEANNSNVDSMLVDAADLTRSQSFQDEEMPIDPPLTATPHPPTSQKMYVEVPRLAEKKHSFSSTAMGSVRPGTGRVVEFVGGEDGEKSEDREGEEDGEEEDVDVSMKAGGEEKVDGNEEGAAKGKEENDESSLDLDSDLELGYPEEAESTPPFVVAPVDAPSEHETEDLIIEDKERSEPSLSRSVSPVLPPLSSARFPPPATTPAIPPASDSTSAQLPLQPNTPPHPPNPTSDAVTHFLHSFTTLTTELHALRAEVADLRRSRDLTTPVVMQLEERVRRVEGKLSARNAGATFSGNALGAVRGLSARVGEGELASVCSHPLAHLVALGDGEDGDAAMDVDVSQTVVEEAKSSQKRKSVGGASGSGSVGKKRNTTSTTAVTGRTNLFITLVSIILVSHTINRCRPWSQFVRLEYAIKKTEDLLLHAEKSCLKHWHGDVVHLEGRMHKVQLTSGDIHEQLLQTQRGRDWMTLACSILETIKSKTKTVEAVKHIPKAFKEYVQDVWLLSQRICECADQVKELEISIQLVMLNERQRQTFERMGETETISTGSVRRRFGAVLAVARADNNSM